MSVRRGGVIRLRPSDGAAPPAPDPDPTPSNIFGDGDAELWTWMDPAFTYITEATETSVWDARDGLELLSMVQGTGAQQPVWDALSGPDAAAPGLTFDGVSQNLEALTIVDDLSSVDLSYYLIAKWPAVSGTDYGFAMKDAGSNQNLTHVHTASAFATAQNNGAHNSIPFDGAVDTAFHLFESSLLTSGSIVRRDADAAATTAVTGPHRANAITKVRMGSWDGSILLGNIVIAGLVIVKGARTTEEDAAMRVWVENTWPSITAV